MPDPSAPIRRPLDSARYAVLGVAVAGAGIALLVTGHLVGLLAFVIAPVALAAARAAVVADPSSRELVIRNPLRTYRIPWAEVHDFRRLESFFGENRRWRPAYAVFVEREHGRRIKCVGVSGGGLEEAGRYLDLLQAAHAAGLRRPSPADALARS